ncbi:zinc-binding alcohol dehydrogenase family protein [Staphylococcus haemolyticus]|uniref:zinc-binding alcohol dehydrogenase family protein n=1 Tax=Staphylococcus haemolyticus TaxID=1283 RepID=UPI0010AD0792|nr:zinc-binding alcohol dehydrogenase family protein [Staphylococcus haemolyticus]MCC3662842.1 zinc-binding alcohol dehydrogenase family protein [Staphylococcus haemolyticus]MCC3715986.1 zinc-binding alcohol dehydrogenase family protein [Staphylococcus haemolyticus]MCH4409218.1 zinc-binding alcohol dehydrogenase family protein [Staphylococcus haemolyticus]MCH4495422.1 zinc-binding alcohol dehydrogenase family protein [Staphylococcus haemolyticus]MDM3981779.1 zinc-binding alcohol dehydrogenase 
MKAIGFEQPFKLSDGNLFKTFNLDIPEPKVHEILVKIQSISVNPVDTKQRLMDVSKAPRVLGFDAIGVVESVGNEVTMFNQGDIVYYSGSPDQNGSNAEYQLINERLVAKAPKNISAEQAVSLPLTGITAYETLFDVFDISRNRNENEGKTLLIINGAGGVGSIATQIAKAYGLRVITTASRNETIEWTKKMGADIVLNHKESLLNQFKTQGIELVDYVFCTFNTDMYYDDMIQLVKPRGHIATIVAFENDQDLNALKPKSLSFSHEFMFARPLNQTDDMIKHHEYLEDITNKVEQNIYQPTTTKVIEGLTTENIYQAHQILESNTMIGKLVINLN